MPVPTSPLGKSPLHILARFNERAHGFYQKTVGALVDAIIDAFTKRTELHVGGTLADGASTSTSTMRINFAGLVGTLGTFLGVVKAFPAATGDTDLNVLVVGAKCLNAIYENGAAAHARTLAASEALQFALIVANSDGAGGVGAPKLLVVFAGTAATAADQTAPPSSGAIQRALAASSGVHDGTTAWAWVAYGTWDDSPAMTATMNVNNVAGL